MIDICFSDSFFTELEILAGKVPHGIIGIKDYINDVKKYIDFGIIKDLLGELPTKVVLLNLGLEYRKIDDEHFEDERLETIKWFFGYERKCDCKRYYNSQLAKLNMIKEASENGESIRIWYSDNSRSLCPLYFLSTYLLNSSSKIYLVKLPKGIHNIAWDQIDLVHLRNNLSSISIATKAEIISLANEWERLKNQKGVLRVNENGIIKNVDIGYYDNQILSCLEDDSIEYVNLVGKSLGKICNPYHFVYDGFVADRIDYLIDSNILEICGTYEYRDEFEERYPDYLLRKKTSKLYMNKKN